MFSFYTKKISLLIFGVFALFFLGAVSASAANLYIQPSTIQATVGVPVSVRVMVSSPAAAVNSYEGTVQFPGDVVSVSNVSKSGSIVGFWVADPSSSISGSSVSFAGVTVDPGYTGSAGTLFSVTIVPTKSGTGTVSLSSASVLANDGLGTNVLQATSPAQIVVSDPVVIPPTPPVVIPPVIAPPVAPVTSVVAPPKPKPVPLVTPPVSTEEAEEEILEEIVEEVSAARLVCVGDTKLRYKWGGKGTWFICDGRGHEVQEGKDLYVTDNSAFLGDGGLSWKDFVGTTVLWPFILALLLNTYLVIRIFYIINRANKKW